MTLLAIYFILFTLARTSSLTLCTSVLVRLLTPDGRLLDAEGSSTSLDSDKVSTECYTGFNVVIFFFFACHGCSLYCKNLTSTTLISLTVFRSVRQIISVNTRNYYSFIILCFDLHISCLYV
jgi:hypothetical protein